MKNRYSAITLAGLLLVTFLSAQEPASPGKLAVEERVGHKVKPGRVRWHPSFADACQAARQSGKPVLLFQLIGKLDEDIV